MGNVVSFKVPSSPQRSIQTIDEFLGVDFTNSPANIDIRRSPNAPNMVRDVPGKVRKTLGYETIKTYQGKKINGCHYLRGDSGYLIHAGTEIYYGDTLLYSTANDSVSKSWQFEDKLYIIDGKQMLVYYQTKSGSTVTHHIESASQNAYIPLLTISKDPTGGGTSYEDLNLLQPGFREEFLGTAGATEYALSFGGLDNTPVQAQVMNAQGTWVTKTEGTDFTVNRITGVITFTTAPGVPPVTGEDNVRITAFRTVSGYADKINKCSVGTLFGMNGGKDRLFLSGNPEFVNYDWHSAPYDPTYFADTDYSRLGSDGSAIIGYSIISGFLATHKDDLERDQNIFIRQGITDDNGNTYFKISNTLQGAGAVAKYSFAYLATEPLFLTSQGIFAVTAQDITGEKYAQNRSFFLNGKLLEEPNLENAKAVVYKDNYILAINGVFYILDGLQPVMTDKSMPYATRQYCAFYRTNVPANTIWVKDDELYFGTADGKVCKFYSDTSDLYSYEDNGQPIECIWETPDIDGKLFYKNKTLRYLAIRTEAAIATSVKIYAMERGLWSLIKEDFTYARYLVFSKLIFSKFSFSTDTTQRICKTKLRIKKVDKFRLKFVNDQLDEPFALYNVAMEYVENGNFKG